MPHHREYQIEAANNVGLVAILNSHGEQLKKFGSQHLWKKHQVWIHSNLRIHRNVCCARCNLGNNLKNIKAKTVGNGQHGTARWARKGEIKMTYAASRLQETSIRRFS